MCFLEVDKKRVGQRIKAIRQSKGMTMEEFGSLFEATKGNVSLWEKGSSIPSNERLPLIAKIADTTVKELLHGTPQQYINNVIYKNEDNHFVNSKAVDKVVFYYEKNNISPYNDDENIINKYNNNLINQTPEDFLEDYNRSDNLFEEIYGLVFRLDSIKDDVKQMIFDEELPNDIKSANLINHLKKSVEILYDLNNDFMINEEAREKRNFGYDDIEND